MPLPPKDVQCKCGNVMSLTLRKLRCVKCGNYIFYNEAEGRRHRNSTIYTAVMLALAAGVVTYLFVEMIVEPLFR